MPAADELLPPLSLFSSDFHSFRKAGKCGIISFRLLAPGRYHGLGLGTVVPLDEEPEHYYGEDEEGLVP